MKPFTNLRAILEYYEIQNKELAQAINVSPSMVSNWVQGKRALRASSGSVVAIVDYILSKRSLSPRDITWLKKHLEQAGITTDFNFVCDIRRSLIIWLSDDGQEVLKIFKKTGDVHIDSWQENLPVSKYLHSIGPAGRIYDNDYSVRAGIVDISLRLGRMVLPLIFVFPVRPHLPLWRKYLLLKSLRHSGQKNCIFGCSLPCQKILLPFPVLFMPIRK